MSGQILLTSIFDFDSEKETSIDYHTADYDADPIYPNGKICPKLDYLESVAVEGDEFVRTNTSADAIRLDDILTGEELVYAPWNNILDCMYTTICNDRPLPTVLDDFVSDEDRTGNFNEIIDHATWQLGYVYEFDDSAYAKLAMAPLMMEVLEELRKAKRYSSQDEFLASGENSAINLFSGHDTTVMPFLAGEK